MEQKCTKCHETFPLTEDFFYKRGYGFRKSCKVCERLRVKQYTKQNRIQILKKKEEYRRQNRVEINQKAKEYRQKNLHTIRDKNKERSRLERINNPQAIKIRQKRYLDKHREEINEKQKEISKKKYYENIDKSRKIARERARSNKARETYKKYYKNVLSKSINYRLRNRFRTAIYKALKLNNSSKENASFLNYVDYSMNELKDYLESKFESWMNWDNWSKYNADTWKDEDQSTWTWQIDHIIPQSKFRYASMEDEGFKKCWELSNLRPLSAKENCLKSNKLEK